MATEIQTIKASQLEEITELTDSNYIVVTDGDTSKKVKATNIKSNSSNSNFRQLSTDLYSKFLYKLRKTNDNVTIIFQGDSTIYGTDTSSDDKRDASTTLTDNGTAHKVTRASISMPEHFSFLINQIYDNRVTVVNKGYSGDSTQLGLQHWNAGGADLKVFSYGINDAANSNISYMGDVTEHLKYYRQLIERELLAGTAVILITPTKQLLVTSGDQDSRMSVDVFANAQIMLADEYVLPWIDGHLLLEAYSADLWSDTTHLNGNGNITYASRLLSAFVGEGVHKPYKINGYDMLGANPLLDNFKLVNGATIIKNDAYPTPDEYIANGGNAIYIKDGGKIVYSFYSDQPNIVAIPSLYTGSANCNINMILDNGIKQARFQNYFYSMDETPVDFTYYQPSKFTITNSHLIDYNSKCFTLRNLKYDTDPALIITNRGWHTITIESNFGNTTDGCTLYGIEFLTFNDYLNKIVKNINVAMNNCEAYDEARIPTLLVNNNRMAVLQGTIKNITNFDNPILTFDSKYAPKVNSTFTVALSASAGGGYGVILVTPGGNVSLIYKSVEGSNFTTLFGCNWIY